MEEELRSSEAELDMRMNLHTEHKEGEGSPPKSSLSHLPLHSVNSMELARELDQAREEEVEHGLHGVGSMHRV